MKKTLAIALAAVSFLGTVHRASAQDGRGRPEAEYDTPPEPVSEADVAKYGLLGPTNVEDSWTFEISDEGKGAMWIIKEAAIFLISNTTGTNWHVQAYQTGLDLEEGKEYVVTLQMKSPEELTVALQTLVDEGDYHSVGLNEEISTTKEYEDYEFTFTASNVAKGKNRISLVLGDAPGIVYVKNMSLKAK
jgi:hypothetical protein